MYGPLWHTTMAANENQELQIGDNDRKTPMIGIVGESRLLCVFCPRPLHRSVSSNHRRATVDDIVESVWTDRWWMALNVPPT